MGTLYKIGNQLKVAKERLQSWNSPANVLGMKLRDYEKGKKLLEENISRLETLLKYCYKGDEIIRITSSVVIEGKLSLVEMNYHGLEIAEALFISEHLMQQKYGQSLTHCKQERIPTGEIIEKRS